MVTSPSPTPGSTTPKESKDPEKTGDIKEASAPDPVEASIAEINYTPKTYLQKISLIDKPRPFTLFGMMRRPLIYLSFPVIAYAGFSYGSNLIVSLAIQPDIADIINKISESGLMC